MKTIRLSEDEYFGLLFSLGYAAAAVLQAQDGTPMMSNAVLEVVNAVAADSPDFVPYAVREYKTDPAPKMVKMLRKIADDLEAKWQKTTKSETGKSKRR